jgi:hypothetical protein
MGRMHTEQLITLTALEPHTCIALYTYNTKNIQLQEKV